MRVRRCNAGLESPDDSGGCAVVVLGRAGVARVHVVALKTPGKVLEGQFVVNAAADINDHGIVGKAAGIQVADAAQGVDEGAPFPHIRREARTSDTLILGDPGPAIKAARVEDQAKVGESGKRKRFEGTIPAVITLRIYDICELGVGDAGVNVPILQEAVELC